MVFSDPPVTVHPHAMAHASNVRRGRKSRDRQQPCGERHQAHRRGQEELAVHRQRSRGRVQRDPLHPHRSLPQPWPRPVGVPARRAHPSADHDQQAGAWGSAGGLGQRSSGKATSRCVAITGQNQAATEGSPRDAYIDEGQAAGEAELTGHEETKALHVYGECNNITCPVLTIDDGRVEDMKTCDASHRTFS